MEDRAVGDSSDSVPMEESDHGEYQEYPPRNEKKAIEMSEYLKNNCQISFPLDPNLRNLNLSIIPSLFTPKETNCHKCGLHLKDIMYTKNGKIFTRTKIIKDVRVVVRKCENCVVFYRYQETTHGVHNFNDKFFIGLDVCLYLISALTRHISIGAAVDVLKDDFTHEKQELNSQLISDALMHFLALCDYNYSFNCVVCGFHPVTLVMDLNKKINFPCTNIVDREDDFDEEVDVQVDCVKFWQHIELNMICKGISKEVAAKLETVPRYKNWNHI